MIVENQNINQVLNNFIIRQKNVQDRLSSQIRKQSGIFFTTSIPVIDQILESLPSDESLFNKIILDPSCGQGIFLLRIITKAYLIYPDEIAIKNFIEKNIYFIDINLDMIEKTQENISELYYFLFKKKFTGKFNDYCLDFTKIKPDLFSINSLNIFSVYGNCDYVLGNPPYITLYGRRDQKKNEHQRKYYLENYDQFPSSLKNGKINYVMLFIEQGLKFLKEEGSLSFIIDMAFIETAYKYCRKYIVENYTIKKLIYNLKVFDDVTSGQIIITIKKEKPTSINKIKVINSAVNNICFVSQSDWFSPHDEFRFRFPRDNNLSKIIQQIFDKKDPTLKEIYPHKNLRTCTMLLNMEDRFTGIKPQHHSSFVDKIYPYYRGSFSIKKKYSKPNYDKYFYYDKFLQDKINDELKQQLTAQGIKNKKRIGLGETIIYDNPKIYIRQSAKELIATYDFNPSAANNSLYVFSLRDNTENSISFLKYLCGLINSTIYTFFAQQRRIIRYNKGKQPQIKISDLYQIFIPQDKDVQKQIIMLVDDIYQKPKKSEEYQSQINELLFKYYQLESQQIQLVKESIESFVK